MPVVATADRPALRLLDELDPPAPAGVDALLHNFTPPAIVREAEKSVTEMAAEIRTLFTVHERQARDSLASAKRIGDLLARIKTRLPHGQFQPWIEANMPFGPRQACKYHRLAREWDKLPESPRLNLSDALRLLAQTAAGDDEAGGEPAERRSSAGKPRPPASEPARTAVCKHRQASFLGGRRHRGCKACDAEAARLDVCRGLDAYLHSLVSLGTVTGPAIESHREALKGVLGNPVAH